MKRILFSTVVLSGLMASAAVSVTVSRAQQRFPWNGLVDVDFALSGTTDGTGYRLDLALVDGDHEYLAATFRTEPVVVGDGAHRVTWDFGKDHPEVALTNVTVKVGVAPLADTDPLYLVFDLSGGKDAKSYPHRYTTRGPDLSSDVCRTTELWMRRVPAGMFKEGNPECYDGGTAVLSFTYLPRHEVILTKPYYLGVFEVTQQQYFLMEGAWQSHFTADRETRPLEKISLQGFRGSSVQNCQNGWYDDGTTLVDSPLLRLRQKTGFETLDLPSAAQWERACRAGYENKYNRPDMNDQNAATFGRCLQNMIVGLGDVTAETPASQGGTAKVGSFLPNPWGFYDMGGNVFELCTSGHPYSNSAGGSPTFGDYAGSPYTDLLGPTPEWCTRTGSEVTWATGATLCGGSWKQNYSNMSVYYRNAIARSLSGGSANDAGIRLCITCE